MAKHGASVGKAVKCLRTSFAGDLAEFLAWRSQLRPVVNVGDRLMLTIVDGGTPPATTVSAGTRRAYQTANWDLFSVLLFSTTGPVESLVQRFEVRSTSMSQAEMGVGDGRAAWLAPEKLRLEH